MKKSTYNRVLKLSKKLEKYQLLPKQLRTEQNKYVRDYLAGAYYLNNKTCLMTEHFGLVLDGKIEGLQMAPNKTVTINIESSIPNYYKSSDVIRIISKEELKTIKERIKNKESNLITFSNKNTTNKYPADQIVAVLECLEYPVVYPNPNQNGFLVVKGLNGLGIVCPFKS